MGTLVFAGCVFVIAMRYSPFARSLVARRSSDFDDLRREGKFAQEERLSFAKKRKANREPRPYCAIA